MFTLQKAIYMSDDRLESWIAFGEEIASRRRALGRKEGRLITQKEIADKVELSDKHYSRLETARSGTDYDTVCRIADVLGYTGEERTRLFALAGMAYPRKTPPTNEQQMQEFSKDIPDTITILGEVPTSYQHGEQVPVSAETAAMLRAMHEATQKQLATIMQQLEEMNKKIAGSNQNEEK